MQFRDVFKKVIRSGWFEYFFWIFLAVFIVTSVLGATLYMYFSSLLKNEAVVQNNNTLSQLKNAQEAVLAETDKSISDIVFDPIIDDYMDYYHSQDTIMMLAAQSKLNSITTLYGTIDSVYVWYISDNMILSTDKGAVQIDDYPDAAFIKSLSFSKNVKSFSRIKEEAFGNQNVSVISFINTVPIYVTAATPKAIVVFNLKSSALQQTINSIKISNHSTILITDSDINIISQKIGNTDEANKKLAEKIEQLGNNASGSFITTVDGEKTLVSYVNSDKYSWRYLYLTPMSVITADIRFLGVMTILFCILFIVLSVLGSLLLSRKLYSPIKTALALLSSSMSDKESELPVKETVLLQSNISSIINKNKSLEELLKDYDASQKDNFLISLLEDTAESGEKLAERLQYYHVDLFTKGFFVVLIISTDNFKEVSEKYSEKQINIYSIYMRENLTDKVFTDSKGFYIEKSKSENILVMSFPASESWNSITNAANKAAKLAHEFIGKNIKFTFTIGISKPCMALENLHECYEEALMAVNHRLLFGYGNIISYENITRNENNSDIVFYPFSLEKKILEGIRTGNRNVIFKFLDEFIGFIQEIRNEDIEFVRYYFLQLLTASVKCFYEINRNFGTNFVKKDYYTTILKGGTINEMTVLMKEMYDEFLDYMDSLRSEIICETNKETVQNICEFIFNNLGSDLSLDYIAEKFNISSYQLRKFFKCEFGVSPKNYIDDLRMKKAAELLRNTNMKIGKIAEQVGYYSIPSFTHTFKAVTGKTPGEYRQTTIPETADS